jgi:hypothetical protein
MPIPADYVSRSASRMRRKAWAPSSVLGASKSLSYPHRHPPCCRYGDDTFNETDGAAIVSVGLA